MMKLLKYVFAFPVDRRPGGWHRWRVRWVPLVVWTCLLNALLFALVSLPRKGGPREALPVEVGVVKQIG